MKSKSFVPAFDIVKFQFFVQGVFSSKKIAGLYYGQTSMCQNHIWHRETMVDEKQSGKSKSFVPAFDIVKFRFFVQGEYSSKKIAGLY